MNRTQFIGTRVVEKGRPTAISPITNPLGKHWEQPAHDEVIIDETHAFMSQSVCDQLKQYDSTNPTGTYEGKMWKRESGGKLWLIFYDVDWKEHDPKMLTINSRRIVINE